MSPMIDRALEAARMMAICPACYGGARGRAAKLVPNLGVWNYLLRVYAECMLPGMSVPLTLLGLLEREPSHGYDLKRDYDAYFGRGKPLPYGQVYATLARLARDGMAIAGPAEHGEG